MSGVFKYCLQMNSIACANERIPRRARKSAFPGIVHFAHCCTFLNGHSFLKTLHIIFYTLAGNSLLHQLSCVQNKKDRGTVTEIYYRYSISVFSCFVIWSERTVPLKRPPASQELLAMCKMNNSREGTRTWPVLSDRILVGYVALPM